MKRYLKTVVTLAILAGLWFGFNYYNKRKGAESAKTAEKPKELILPVKKDQVQAFTLAPRDGEAFTVKREGGAWSIIAPRPLAADQGTASTYAGDLVGASVDSVADEHPASLKDFGLAPPALTVSVTTTGKPAQLTLLLGDATPTGDAVYAQVAGQARVITISGYGKSPLDKSLFDLRDKRALTLDTDQIDRLDVSTQGKSYTLTKNPDGVWDVLLPPAVRADNFAVQNLISGFQALPMVGILQEDKKDLGKYGFDKPALTVKVTTPAGSQTLTVGKKDGSNYDAMNSALDPVFTLSSDFVPRFQNDPSTLRDKSFFTFSDFDAKNVDLTTPKEHRVFAQSNFKWKQSAPAAKDEDTDKMNALLDSLTALKAVSFPKATPGNLAPFGLTKPLYTFKVTFGAKDTVETVNVGSVNDHYYAARSTDAVPGEISKTLLDAIEKALGAL